MEKLASDFFKFDENIFDHNSFALSNVALLAEMREVDIEHNILRIEVDIVIPVFLVLSLQKIDQLQASKLSTHHNLNDFK